MLWYDVWECNDALVRPSDAGIVHFSPLFSNMTLRMHIDMLNLYLNDLTISAHACSFINSLTICYLEMFI